MAHFDEEKNWEVHDVWIEDTAGPGSREVLQQLARDWRELVAGSEGFLTNDIVRGLFRHNVTWGEMVCI